MDVVYNHTYSLESWLWRTVPWYYYRQNEDGTVDKVEDTRNITETYKQLHEVYMNPVSLMSLEDYGNGGYKFTTFEDLKEISTMTFNNWTTVFYAGEGPLVIEEDVTLPRYATLNFNSINDEIVVPAGVTFQVNGENAYGLLKSEHGVHRLVRISPFNAMGKRQTSFAAVEVVPDIGDEIEVNIDPNDLKIDTYRSGGAGGQHVNTTDSAVRITHIPTGIVVTCQNERSQIMNREVAMKILVSKLTRIAEEAHKENLNEIKGDQSMATWGSQIRNYVFQPYTMVKDTRTGAEVGNVEAVMDGDLDVFVRAKLSQDAANANG
jgi:protein subunit release factor B